MRDPRVSCLATVCFCVVAAQSPASAQIAESVGSRALGMGGAFVAVASDSSATWWNPAGLAAGPFVDIAWAREVVETTGQLPVQRHRTSWFALATPPVGFGYYRFRITDIQPFDPTGQAGAGREDTRAGVAVRSLSASQLGVTLVQTLIPGVHAGTTLKYVRGTIHGGPEDSLVAPADLLALGEAFDDGDAESQFDVDVGVLAIGGALRLGALVRNVLEPEFATAVSTPNVGSAVLRLPRQVRMGAAFDPERVTGVPLTVALDADLRAYDTASGARRVVALGAEYWFLAKRLGVRTGGRVNTRGARERSATAGMSVAVRPGLYVDGHAVRGGAADEKGWGLAARVSF